MKVIHLTHPLQNVSTDIQPCVMALGFFDGIHIGHQQVIQTAKSIAEEEGLELSVMTFYPHPKQVFKSSDAPFHYLTPLSRKKEIFANLGVQKLYIVQFDSNFSALSPKDFVHQYLIDFRVQHVVAGFDFRYGYKAKGNMQTLKTEGEETFKVEVVEKVTKNGEKISSTLIRELIISGYVSLVPQYLGNFYEIQGRIDSLHQSDKTSHLSTVKIDVIDQYLLPKTGVYAVETRINNKIFHGVCEHHHQLIVNIHSSNLFKISSGEEIKIKWLFRIGEGQGLTSTEDMGLYKR